MRSLISFGLVTLALTASADLDVSVPPGSPIEWLGEIPTVDPASNRGRVPTARFAGETVVSGAKPRMVPYSVGNLYSYVRIVTWDLPSELSWTTRTTLSGTGMIETGAGKPLVIKYPPPVTDDVYWLAMTALLRRMLHPAQVGDAETLQYLITLGEPALAAAEASSGEASLKNLCAGVREGVKLTPPHTMPSTLWGATDYEKMMYRLVVEDLVRGYPFALDGEFAARIRFLGDEAAPFVIRASRDPHEFLRRNATLYLGVLNDAAALERLREILLETDDKVCRNRALDALVRRRDTASVQTLAELLSTNKDRSFTPFLIQALGALGGVAAKNAIVSKAKSAAQDYDMLVAVGIALGRVGIDTDEVRSLLRRLDSAHFTDPVTTYSPVTPDEEGTRTQTVRQIALAVRAILGTESSAKSLAALAGGRKEEEPGDDGRGRFRAARGRLSKFHPAAMNLALEALGRHEMGRDVLRDVVKDDREEGSLRANALFQLCRGKIDAELCAELADLAKPQPLAEVALKLLASTDRSKAVEIANGWINEYRTSLLSDKRHLVSVAVQMLGPSGQNDRGKLIEIIKEEGAWRRRLPKGAMRGRVPGGQFEVDLSLVPPLLEHAMIELGRFGGRKRSSRESLDGVLMDDQMPGRGEACLAMAGVGSVMAYERLLGALEDRDGWVRFMAYRALRHASGEDHFCDWLYAPADARMATVDRYKRWLDKYADK